MDRTLQKAMKRNFPGPTIRWIQKWAAIGDSSTAGIGSGSKMGMMMTADRK